VIVAWTALGAAAETPGCGYSADLPALTGTLDELESAWTDLDEERFRHDADQLRLALRCASVVLPTAVVARTHRAFALDAWVRGDPEAAVGELRAARAVDPSWTPPENWLPEALAQAADQEAPAAPGRAVPRPHDGEILFEGRDDRRPDGPAVMQWVGDGGAVHGSWYLHPQDPLPDYDSIPRSRGILRTTSLVAVGLGGALYAGAFAERAAFEDASTRASAMQARGLTNGLTGAGLGLVGLGAVVAVVSW
jgi:hypothetical protein